ncbi:hypothetical protein BDV93DRAFT_310363 [Ceratobasidium sp. AG-I]|nr:hypothetical protein BDV93DRAFT_310363 [Ceratobasidium sp. AG-I]
MTDPSLLAPPAPNHPLSAFGPSFTNMQAGVFIALGAGAFVTTTVAATLLLHRSVDTWWERAGLGSRRLVEVDIEKAPELNEAKHSGWREYIADDEKAAKLAPISLDDPQLAPSVIVLSTNQTPSSPERLFPTPPEWRELPQTPKGPLYDPYIPKHAPLRIAVSLPEGAISATREASVDIAPEVPPGLGERENEEAVIGVLPAALRSPLDEKEDLLSPGVNSSGIMSWPALVPALTEDTSEHTALEDSPVEESAHFKSSLRLNLAPSDDSVVAVSTVLSEPHEAQSPTVDDNTDPFADPVDPFRTPQSQSPASEAEEELPPIYTRYDTIKSPTDSKAVEVFIVEPTLFSPKESAPSITIRACIDQHNVEYAARVPLPLSVPATPKPRPSPLVLMLDLSRLEGVRSARSLHATPITLIFASQADDADETPMSSASSGSGTCSSGPTTPVELKQVLEVPEVKLVPALDSPPASPIVGEEAEEDRDIVIGEVMDVPDDLDEQAPDPSSPTLQSSDRSSPEWAIASLPGSFTQPQRLLEAKPASAGAGAVQTVDVPLLTADMVQLCRAMLAVSNCAGLVAQFVVGFSMWWSLMLVPTSTSVLRAGR